MVYKDFGKDLMNSNLIVFHSIKPLIIQQYNIYLIFRYITWILTYFVKTSYTIQKIVKDFQIVTTFNRK